MLILPIKKKWFDMILSGEKKEEYREIKQYYDTRFKNVWGYHPDYWDVQCLVCFRNGYSNNSPSFNAWCSLRIGCGEPEWGAEPNKKYYVLTIHEIMNGDVK